MRTGRTSLVHPDPADRFRLGFSVETHRHVAGRTQPPARLVHLPGSDQHPGHIAHYLPADGET